MIKTKVQLCEEVLDANTRNMVISEIDQVFYKLKAKTMPHNSKERLLFMQKSNAEITKQSEDKIIIKAITMKLAEYKRKEKHG